ncbi:hypothetical protein C1645_831260 [Glomus cerebriforme]|uniref:Uncharacterized protein n=1 Tax=Glomus cerebriforme TaxID=658196 RepID=A0A397SGG9_9GLOM|nr:hypothetical protein C1645_831260 [Glomus cerebriforme]
MVWSVAEINALIIERRQTNQFTPEDNNITQLFSISSEIMDITFNEIVNESIDMIVDQLDSTHLSDFLPNTSTDQLST